MAIGKPLRKVTIRWTRPFVARSRCLGLELIFGFPAPSVKMAMLASGAIENPLEYWNP
jgi:hypothetical protein